VLTVKTLKSGRFDAHAIASLTMPGAPGELTWSQNETGLKVVMPATPPGLDVYALKMTFKTPKLDQPATP